MIPPSCLLTMQEVDWTEVENREPDGAETLKILSPHTPYGYVRLARLALKTCATLYRFLY